MTNTVLKEERFSIAGMRCGGCALALEKRLKEAPGVSSARVNATTHGLVIRFDEARLNSREIEAIVDRAGYAAHPDKTERALPENWAGVLAELAVAGFGMMNVMLFSVAVWAGLTSDMGAATVQFMNWAAAALAAPVILFAARPFYSQGFRSILSGRMTMDVAISIAILGTFLASFFETASGADHVYFDAAIALTFFLLIGRQLDHMLRTKSQAAVNTLKGLLKPECQRIYDDGRIAWVDITDLQEGDIVLIPKGERAPTDGQIVLGVAWFDESVLTGEADPALKEEGDNVCAAALNVGEACEMCVVRAGSDSSLESVMCLVQEAASEKGERQHLADRFAASYGPFVLISSIAAFILWYVLFGADAKSAFEISIAVLVVTCPCAAGLATPAVAARASNLLLEQGVIVKSGAALERLALANKYVCDKTGTLSILSSNMEDASEPAKSLANLSSHPVAKTIAGSEAHVRTSGVRELPGFGIEDGEGNRLGTAAFVGARADVAEGPELWFKGRAEAPTKLSLQEGPKEGLAEFLEDLRCQNIECSILSGDRQQNVSDFAHRYGIDDAIGDCKPAQKLQHIRNLQRNRQIIAMLGDGLNDAAPLSQADVSLSFAEASETARNAADIIILGSSLNAVTRAREVAQKARQRMTENLTFAALYNVVTVPIALAGLLTPFWAAIFMSSSSILVMLNAYRLRTTK